MKFFVEVKATHVKYAKMTLTQAEEAGNSPEDHVLCVVELGYQDHSQEAIRKSAKFVTDIGNKVKNKTNKVMDLQSQQETLIENSEDVGVEYSKGEIRIVIKEPIWASGKSIDEFLDFVKNRS